jgi:hypothetical protein
MYLVVNYEDGSSGVVEKIENKNRIMVNDGNGQVFRMEEMKFQTLVVDVEDAEENDDDAVEEDGEFYTFGDDRWTDAETLS